jgi:hypothetical protein
MNDKERKQALAEERLLTDFSGHGVRIALTAAVAKIIRPWLARGGLKVGKIAPEPERDPRHTFAAKPQPPAPPQPSARERFPAETIAKVEALLSECGVPITEDRLSAFCSLTDEQFSAFARDLRDDHFRRTHPLTYLIERRYKREGGK